MITASHNPPLDNGVKVIDWTGGMLPMECEAELDSLINSDLKNDEVQVSFCQNGKAENSNNRRNLGHVVIGTDTRSSSPELMLQALKGLEKAEVSSHVFCMLYLY